ncbi:hypothetical protein HDZ31DRAFT_79097 [Schizophyllum fasciatum]
MSRAGPSSFGSRSLWQRISSPPPQLDGNSLSGPSQDASGKRQRKRKREPPPPEMLFTPWLDLCRHEFATCGSALDKLHYEILAYERYMAPTSQEAEARSRAQTLIMNALRDLPCIGQLQLFGSTAIGIVTPTRSGDLCIDGEHFLLCMLSDLDMVNVNPRLSAAGHRAIIDALWAIGRRLRQQGIVHEFNVVKWARVPIITFTTRLEFGSFDVDIGVNNVDGLHGVPILRGYLSTMPALRPLLFVLKRFLAQRDLGNAAKSGLGGYGLMCLIIAFLRNNPQERPQSYIDSPVEERTLGILLQDFFEFYGTIFDYETLFIAPEEGAYPPKVDGADWIGDIDKAAYRLVVKCPVTPGHDVAKSTGRTVQIIEAFQTGFSTLENTAITDETVLGSLIGVPQNILDRRDSLRHLMDDSGFGLSPPRDHRYDAYYRQRPPPLHKRPRHDYY